jgi:short-subunit dehydrogenase
VRHLITGAGSGIGNDVAHLLTNRGDEVWLVVRSEERAQQLAAIFPFAEFIVADLADPAALEASSHNLEIPDELDTLLHIAGVVDLNPISQLSVVQIQEQLNVNLVAPIALTRAALPALRANARFGSGDKFLSWVARKCQLVGVRCLEIWCPGIR